MDKEKIAKWFVSNFRIHTDWTGSYVEYKNKGVSIKEIIDKFFSEVNI